MAGQNEYQKFEVEKEDKVTVIFTTDNCLRSAKGAKIEHTKISYCVYISRT